MSSGSIGDIIYSLAAVRQLVGGSGKGIYYLRPNVPADYAKGIVHPCGGVRMDTGFARAVMPLIASQPYIASCRIWDGEEVDYDFDKFRETGFNFASGDIARYPTLAYPEAQCDLGQAWLTVEPDSRFADYIIVNRTGRYRNNRVNYGACLCADGLKVLFMGLRSEWEDFRRFVPADYLETRSLLQVAQALAGCRFFLGNQSSVWAIAEGLKIRRAVEICGQVPNCPPHGKDGYDFFDGRGLGAVVERLKSDTVSEE